MVAALPLPYIILFAPALACAATVLFGRTRPAWAAAFPIAAMGTGLAASLGLLLLLLTRHDGTVLESSIPWISLPGLNLEFGLLVDPLSVLMSVVVTGVGLVIFIYSVGYMEGDRGFARYFAFLALFAFSMLGIVLSNNLVTLFIFWELVGASSYLLIGHWYDRPRAAEAGKKAFLVNRIADFGFLLGILMLWNLSGLSGTRTLNFLQLSETLPALHAAGEISQGALAVTALLIFCGVIGKSAQFPLHVWLPDAMEGPTPVSALIHAATMVAAGVYLIARLFFLFWASPPALEWIAWAGGFTALFAAALALAENDLKRILAYSTLSQLGTMVMALGLGGYVAGIFHLTTHAFFKALLFLGAGCVIHALKTNEIWEMGGLLRKMPVTGKTFLLAALALAGLFPLSGFWSKDEILAVAFDRNRILWGTATLTAAFTAFYMGRAFSVAFLGTARSGAAEHAHEAPPVMTVPLLLLAVPTALAGFIGIPRFLHHGHAQGVHVEFNAAVALFSTVAALAGLALSWAIYVRGWRPASRLQAGAAWLVELVRHKFYIDEIYGWLNRNLQQRLAILLSLFERAIIIGLCVNGTARVTGWAGSLLRLAQTGKVQAYAWVLFAGLTLMITLGWRWAR